MSALSYFDAYTCIGPRPKSHPAAPFTLEHLLEEMAHCSIDGALVTSTACFRYDPMRENLRLCAQLIGREGLFALWHVFPHWTGECPEPQRLLRLIEENGAARAVVLAPATARWDPFSATSRPLLSLLEQERVLTIIDARQEMAVSSIERLAGQYPNLPILMRNLSFRSVREAFPILMHLPNVHVTFDGLQMHLGIEWLIDNGCAKQLIYSSGATDWSMGAHRCYVDYAEADQPTRAAVAGGNLIRLLKGQQPAAVRENVDEDMLMAEARQGKPLSIPVIDAHAHILHEGLHGGGGDFVMFDGGPAGVRRLCRRLGVEAVGIMSWNGLMIPDPDEGNHCVREALDAFPEFYWGLATFDPVHEDEPSVRKKLEQTFADGRFLGLKPYTTFGLHYDDSRYTPWWTFGNERGLYAGLHPNRQDLSEFDVLCPKYPNMTFVAFHCGQSYAQADAAIQKAQRYDNFLAEITMSRTCLGVIDYLVEGCGSDRVLYGSDLPMRDPRQQLGWVVYSRLSLENKKQVLGGNASALIDSIRRRHLGWEQK